MKVTIIKKYTDRYYIVSVMPRNANIYTVEQREQACINDIQLQAYDAFVVVANRYSSINRQPKYSEVSFNIEVSSREVSDDTVLLGASVTVSWIYEA